MIMTGLLLIHRFLLRGATGHQDGFPFPVLPRVGRAAHAYGVHCGHVYCWWLGAFANLCWHLHMHAHQGFLGQVDRVHVHPQPSSVVHQCRWQHHHRYCCLLSSAPGYLETELGQAAEASLAWHLLSRVLVSCLVPAGLWSQFSNTP